MKNARIFFKNGSYPDFVKIVSKKLNLEEKIEFTSLDMFLNYYKHYLAIAKSPFYEKVEFFVNPSTCAMIWYEGQTMISTGGYIDLKNIEDIAYYNLEDNNYYSPILEDLFEKHLYEENRYLKQALTDISFTDKENNKRIYDCNFDMANAGDRLMKFAINDYLFELYNESMIDLTYQEKHYLTDKQLIEIIAKKYNLLNYIKCSDELRKIATYSYSKKTIFVAKAVKAILYAIFLNTKNYNEIVQIVRDFILSTDTTEKNFDIIEEKYKKLSKYLKSKYNSNEQEYITFEEAEQAINGKLDYQFFHFTGLFRDYGYYIMKVDFDKKLIYLNISYL